MLQFAIDKITRMAEAMKSETIIAVVFGDKMIQAETVFKNREQLQKGIQSNDAPTGEYSPGSVIKFGKEPGVIKLYETGEFYDSMEAKTDDVKLWIEANTIKQEEDYKDKGLTVDLLDRWPKALGLNEKSKTDIRAMAIPVIVKSIRAAIAG